MLVAVDVIDPGDARPEFGLGPNEGLESKRGRIRVRTKPSDLDILSFLGNNASILKEIHK